MSLAAKDPSVVAAAGGAVVKTSADKSANKCGSCGSTSIDVDPSRAEAVCTNCGDVIESSMIVSDVQFEENAHGGSSAIGQFVHSDSKGGATGTSVAGAFGRGPRGMSGGGGFGAFAGIGRDSRDSTLGKAREQIRLLGQQLKLRTDWIETAVKFYQMALSRNLTRGRKSTHVIGACIYITCRTEGTPHMLIDLSDRLQVNAYELGRTYLRLSQELFIKIPAIDPCLYVMRFAHKLEFGDKTHEVSMTALRLVSRMKKDWIHFGRRPSGLCGAALLIAARLHNFYRTVGDVIKVVRVHESTLRKRLSEFGETPASQLTLDEFMNVDLDAMTEEQDPPSFKAARKKDKELLDSLERQLGCREAVDEEFSSMESEIERKLEAQRRARMARGPFAKMCREDGRDGGTSSNPGSPKKSAAGAESESEQTERFIAEETLGAISEIFEETSNSKGRPAATVSATRVEDHDKTLMPPPAPKGVVASPGLGLKDTLQEYLTPSSPSPSSSKGLVRAKKEEGGGGGDRGDGGDEEDGEDSDEGELDLTDIDEAEIDGYIMSEAEIRCKTDLWMKVNAEYLREKAEKEERERKEQEEAIREGREVKKKKSRAGPSSASGKKKSGAAGGVGGHQTAIEAIEKIVQEKKMSTKINYDVLRSLNSLSGPATPVKRHHDEDEDDARSPGLFGQGPSNVSSPAVNEGLVDALSPTLNATRGPSSPSKSKRLRRTSASSENPKTPATPETVVETGPIQRATEEDLEDEEEDEEDMDDEDVSTMSAAQLLSKHMGGGAGDDDYYGEEEEYY